MAASPEKRCLYEILGLQLDCTADEIRSAYKKLALQRHPDKLMRSGLSQAEATASFQELVNAYEVLSDPRERAWYDSHRSQILFSNSNPSNSSTSIPNLFSFFSNSVFSGFSDTGKGFYKVYGDIFDKIYQNELNFANKLGLGGVVNEAPVMGNLISPYSQVNAFYGYWLGFATVMDFVWVDEYDAAAGVDRRSRRKMEEENKKIRKKAKRDYNETVRGLAAFAKKRDKRVIDMQVKRNEEMERKKEEERKRKKELEREKAERARAYKEQEWAKVEEMEEEFEEVLEEGERKKEFYCVVCGKKFKSEKQWRNHEQSKKHKEKVAELREAFGDEEMESENENEAYKEGVGNEVEESGFVSADDGMDELMEQFVNGVEIQKQENGGDDDEEAEGASSEEEVFVDIYDGGELKGVAEKLGLDDDEASMLEAMLSGHRSRKNKKGKTMASSMEVHVEVDGDEMKFMEYNDRKGTRRNRGSRKQKGRRADDEAMRGDAAEIRSQAEEIKRADEGLMKDDAVNVNSLSEEKNGHVDSSLAEETASSHSFVENETEGKGEDLSVMSRKVSKPAVDKKGTTKKDKDIKSKTASKGRKQKASSKTSSDNICEKCGVDFESRTKLHKHLKDTGHATLKSR